MAKRTSKSQPKNSNEEKLDSKNEIETKKSNQEDLAERIERAIPAAGGRVVAPGLYAFPTAFSKKRDLSEKEDYECEF